MTVASRNEKTECFRAGCHVGYLNLRSRGRNRRLDEMTCQSAEDERTFERLKSISENNIKVDMK